MRMLHEIEVENIENVAENINLNLEVEDNLFENHDKEALIFDETIFEEAPFNQIVIIHEEFEEHADENGVNEDNEANRTNDIQDEIVEDSVDMPMFRNSTLLICS